MIKVIHIKDMTYQPYQVYCGRPNAKSKVQQIQDGSILQNPFYMRDESQRDKVCDEFQVYFEKKMGDKSSDVFKEMRELWKIHASHGKLELVCYCAPKRCHCDTIKNFLDQYL